MRFKNLLFLILLGLLLSGCATTSSEIPATDDETTIEQGEEPPIKKGNPIKN